MTATIALSPYHLTTREPAALAALLLGDRCVTIVPPPLDLRGLDPVAAGRRVPAFAEFIRSWHWSQPLWKRGLLAPGLSPASSGIADVLAVNELLRTDPAFHALRHFVKDEDRYADEEAYLHAVAGDLLKAGPDPGISLPVCAGLDRYAARTGMFVARSRPHSLAQQAEAGLGHSLCSFAVPGFLQASANRILHVREVLAGERSALASALAPLQSRLIDPREQHESLIGRDVLSDIHDAAGTLQQAWSERRDELLMGTSDDEVRVIEGTITIAVVRQPWRVALTSSVLALAAVAPPAPSTPATQSSPHPRGTALMHADALHGREILSLLIKPMGQPQRPSPLLRASRSTAL